MDGKKNSKFDEINSEEGRELVARNLKLTTLPFNDFKAASKSPEYMGHDKFKKVESLEIVPYKYDPALWVKILTELNMESLIRMV
jgi:hypothetical protein